MEVGSQVAVVPSQDEVSAMVTVPESWWHSLEARTDHVNTCTTNITQQRRIPLCGLLTHATGLQQNLLWTQG